MASYGKHVPVKIAKENFGKAADNVLVLVVIDFDEVPLVQVNVIKDILLKNIYPDLEVAANFFSKKTKLPLSVN